MKIEQTECSETSANKIHDVGESPKGKNTTKVDCVLKIFIIIALPAGLEV